MSLQQRRKKIDLDRFQMIARQISDWMAANLLVLSLSAGVTVLGGVAIVSWRSWQEAVVIGELDALARVDREVERKRESVERQRQEVEAEVAALEKALESESVGDDLRQKNREKISNLRRRSEKVQVDFSPEIAQFAELIARFEPQSRYGQRVALSLAPLLIASDQLGRASEVLAAAVGEDLSVAGEDFLGRFLVVQLGMMLVEVYEQLGMNDKMLSLTQKLVDVADQASLAQRLLVAGRAEIKYGDASRGRELLDRLSRDHADAPEAAQAKGYRAVLSRLEAKPTAD